MSFRQKYSFFLPFREILRIGALLSFLLFSCQAEASSALSNMFESFAGSTNVTSPGSYSDQAAGYYTGGGFTSRNSSNSLRPLRLSLPHIGSSCRGIDAYFGGFSFVKGEQLVQMIRNMGQQAVSYGFQLALKTMAPQVETLLAQLRKLGLDANKLAIDECNTVQQMFASALPKGSLAHEQACLDITSQGGSNDWFGARESCQQDPNQVNQAIDQYKREAPDLLIGEYNLTWEAMKKVPGLTDDRELAQYIMSVVGTLISKKIDPVNHPDKYAVSTKEGKGDSLEFIKSNLEKTSTELLVCDETDKCLNPSWQEVPIAQDQRNVLVEKVRRLVSSIQSKYLGRQELTDEEMNFLQNGQKTPIYSYIQVSAAAGSSFLMDDACHYMAIALILQQFETFSQKILSYLDNLAQVQIDDTQILAFKANLQSLRARIHQVQSRADNGTSHRLMHMIRTYEKIIESQ